MSSTLRSRSGKTEQISLSGRAVEFRTTASRAAKKLRIRVGISGVEVILPAGRSEADATHFLLNNASWVLEQLNRLDRFRHIRRPKETVTGQILLRGRPTSILIKERPGRARANRVIQNGDDVVVLRSAASGIEPARSLENWLRKQARREISLQLKTITTKLKRDPEKILIMGQRTKWGNCSSLRNLSFNWRLILAPEFVLKYLVVHEAVHLAIPDHSHKFWLTVQSHCPESERARRWLSANAHQLQVNLGEVCS